MSKWCGNENCLQCIDREPDPYVHLPREDYQTLRDERDRLRAALVKCRRELWYCNNQLKYMGATEGYSVTEALCEAGAALTPAGGGQEHG